SAMLYRFLEITPEACAAVFTREGFITHAWRSKTFDRQKYWISPGKLSPTSQAYNVMRGRPSKQNMQEVDALSWLELPEDLADQSIFEQSEYFPNLRRGVTLLWINSGPLLRN